MGARKLPARYVVPGLRHLCNLWMVLPLALLSGCSLPAADADAAVGAVRSFVVALEARDASAIIALLEPTDWREEIGPELRSYLGMLAELDLRDETYAVVEGRGDTAVVEVTGSFAYRFAEGGGNGERPVNLRVELVRVDERWYLRGLELPQPGG